MQVRTANRPPNTPLSPKKNNRVNKTYQSRLTRWVDRLLPFIFNVSHIPGKNMGFADYVSRYPISPAPPISDNNNNFVINTINAFTHTLENAHRILTNQNARKTSKQHYVTKERKQDSKSKHAFSLIVTKFSRLLPQIFHTQLNQQKFPIIM